MKPTLVFVHLVICSVIGSNLCYAECERSVTTASGTKRPSGEICKGDLIFEENFDELDLSVWKHENTLGGGGNNEFQWYCNNRSNSYVENGIFYIRPSLTSDQFDEDFLFSGTLNLNDNADEPCTNSAFVGCERTGTKTNVLNPVKSARVHTIDSFAFLYGRLEINAKLPSGDWLWPALWLLPAKNVYGIWPASGEIDVMESRGNLNLEKDGINIGPEQVGSTLHFGPNYAFNGYQTSTFTKSSTPGKGFNLDFHRYQLEWTPEFIKFSVDDDEIGKVAVGDGFWARGGFAEKAPGVKNPWAASTSPMAPFDQEFQIILNLAVGGTAFFPDTASNPGGKPWTNDSPHAATEFWNGRDQWLPTWNSESALQVDYVRVWAL